MTTVEIKYSLTSTTCKIFIDADRVSSFSDLASCEGRPLHLCAVKLVKLLDEEIGDDYTIQITGFPFQTLLLTELAKKSRYCTGVAGTNLEKSMSIDTVRRFFVSLAHRYSIASAKQDLKIHIAGSASASASDALSYLLLDEHAPELQIEYPQIAYDPYCKTVAVLSSNYDIQYKGNSCIFSLPSNQLDAFLEYYYAVCKVQPFVEDVANACKYLLISEADKLALTYVTTLTPQYYFFLEKNTVEIGEKVRFQFRSFPKDAFTLRCDKQSMLSFESDTVSCTAGGMVKLFVCNQSGNVELEQQLVCIQHNYITSIRLQAAKTILKENEHIMVNAYTLPEKAEDANLLEWSVSDYDIAHVTANGEVIALKPGRFTLTVKSRIASSSMEMRVASEIESISVHASQNSVEIGGKVELICSVTPPDAHVKGFVWSLENEKMGSLTKLHDEYHYLFTATTDHLGTAKVLCHPKGAESGIMGSCEISVQPENRPSGFIACTLVFTILGLVQCFLIPALWAAGGGIAGYFVDFFLPASLVMSLIGSAKYPEIRTFRTCLILNVIFTVLMLIIAFSIG